MFKNNLLCITLLLTIFSARVFASGIQVLGTTVTTNDDKKSAQIKFSLMWDHSWRLADGPANWDAAWVFIKYRTMPGDNWRHAYIKATGSEMPDNASFKIGNSVAVVGGVNTTVGVGAFIFRKEPGNGTVVFTDCELYWDFSQNGLTGGEQVEVCVLATEMVYIPQVSFYLGDYTSVGRFKYNTSQTSNTTTPAAEQAYQISSATSAPYFSNAHMYTNQTSATYVNPINTVKGYLASIVAPSPDDQSNQARTNLYNNTGTTANGSAITANFPRGFNAFYCMKYEITQGEYLQFLNKNLVAVKNAKYYFYDDEGAVGRYSIRMREGTGTATYPAEYELANPSAAYLPCNYLGTKDITAWLIWAGLRPMTELEFEKICRGPVAIPGTGSLRPQYAWGSIDIYPAAGFANKGGANEAPQNADGNCAVATTAGATIGGGTNTALDGPMRSGGFSTPVSSREKAGATYYGVMEMSGNLWERCITAGLDAGRAFQGWIVNGHGNGDTGPGVNPDLPIGGGWPAVGGAGLGFRGGSYLDEAARARISDRTFINLNNTSRHQSFGGRGVRSDL